MTLLLQTDHLDAWLSYTLKRMPSSSVYDRPREGHESRYADNYNSQSKRRSPSPIDSHFSRSKDGYHRDPDRSHRCHERRHEDVQKERRSNFRDHSEEDHRSRRSESHFDSSNWYHSPSRKYRLNRDRSDKYGISSDNYDEHEKKDRYKEDRRRERSHKHRDQNEKSRSRKDAAPMEEDDAFELLRRRPTIEEAIQKTNGHHMRTFPRDEKDRERRRDSSTRRDDSARSLDRRKHTDARFDLSDTGKEKENGNKRIKHESFAERRDQTHELQPKEGIQKISSVNGMQPPPPPPVERPATPSSLPPTVLIPWSFPEVKLPHELLKEEWPVQDSDCRILKPFRLMHDPVLAGGAKSRHPIKTDEVKSNVVDPRKSNESKRTAREDVRILKWKWDKHSTNPPPCAVVVTQLSSLTTIGQLKQHFQSFGKIAMTDLKIDNQTGESLGIFYVRFCQDYNEDKSLKPEAKDPAQRGDVVAREAVEKSNGQKIGGTVVKAFLDNDKMSKFILASTSEMARKYAPKPKQEAKEEAITQTVTSPSLISESKMPPPDAPKGPRGYPSPTPPPPITVPHHRNGIKPHHLNFAASPHFSRSPMTSQHGASSPLVTPNHNGSYLSRSVEEGRNWRPSHSTGQFARGNVVLPHHQTSSLNHHHQREGSPPKSLPYFIENQEKPYVFIRKPLNCNLTRGDLIAYLDGYKSEFIHSSTAGWYFAFEEEDGAQKCALLDGESLNGFRLRFTVMEPNLPRMPAPKRPSKTHWNEEALLADSKLLILHELGESFMQDLKRRVFKSFLDGFIKRESVGGKAIHSSHQEVEKEEVEGSDTDAEAAKPVVVRRRRRLIEDKGEEQETEDLTLQPVSESEEETELAEPESISVQSKVASKRGKNKKTFKIVEVVEEENDALERETEEALPPTIKAKRGPKKAREKSPAVDPIATGLADNEEDLYYMKVALEKMKNGMSAAEIQAETLTAIENLTDLESGPGVRGLPRHSSGCARTEGFYKIPPAEKALHLPDRNRAVVDPASAVGLASARDNRADSRRFVQGIEQHKKETASDTDILKFNQLRSRKKQLKFAKSPIHDWGLYAMEMIPAGDMVIEYVGEIVRQQVADQREKMYEKQGNFSTYLFRVDDDVVVDATKKGNIARLMNVSIQCQND